MSVNAVVRKSVFILRDSIGESVLVKDGELVHCRLPVVSRTTPIGGDIAQCQPDQFGGSIITGEVPARLDDFS